MISRRALLTMTASAAAAIAIAVPASAGIAVRSTVTINYNGYNTFHGHVSSRKAFCVRHRKVWVYGDGQRLDYDFTNRKGKWRLSTQLQGTSAFYAGAARKRGHGIVCKRASSKVVY